MNKLTANNSAPIGVFDSGTGGLSVLKELKKVLPNENFIYFGDTKRMPYGEKTQQQLHSYCEEILDWFSKNATKAVISACNTSSAVVLPSLKKPYPFDIFGMIDPTAKNIANLNFKNIGIIATSATIRSSAYKNKISEQNPSISVIEQACPGLVEIIENNKINESKSIDLIESYLKPLINQKIEALVLGCTHYPFLESLILDITNNEIELINPATIVAQSVKEALGTKQLLNTKKMPGSVDFYVSQNPELFEEVGKMLYPECQGAKLLTF